ncbi:MAG: pyridoxamine 5'-phosphate oxidase [Bacteroidetes bacterium GWA2_40_15]|nr:MAG: pyridoxamine 5'-phosphate oxidase [Bacteroidetes bacterium GWA2_40_15]OFX82725.1 MAG: pyridoxamine 5'-phosphate oxidase [Bacteroidetes bacterium GWC2_40_22]HBH84010.1 pyridoxamine 5'-phosphate oxidase [Bacteroidales bacterium]HBQ84419.1 pyridoxamine 5'-phosphate oxidase [Bacteroidales bacterium]
MKKKSNLSERSVDADPFRQFKKWYADRLKTEIYYPDSVTLATSTADGHVSARTVLLKDFSDNGFVFFTNYNSKKGQQLSQNPGAAMLFYWPESGRQVRIEGVVEKVSAEESEAYFRTRPRESQIGAWASEQSAVIPGRAHLEKRVEFHIKKFSDNPVPKPYSWGGFLLIPEWIEFWQEGEFRLHDRIIYTRNVNQWKIERLAP